MENKETTNTPQNPTPSNGNVGIPQVNTPDMIKQGSVLPTFVAPPPPPPTNDTK
jgi:hypothetical protein